MTLYLLHLNLATVAHLRRLDAALLDVSRYNVDTVLREDNEVGADLVDLLDEAGELVAALHEHLLLGLVILAEEGLVGGSVHVVIQLDGAVKLDSELGGLDERLR